MSFSNEAKNKLGGTTSFIDEMKNIIPDEKITESFILARVEEGIDDLADTYLKKIKTEITNKVKSGYSNIDCNFEIEGDTFHSYCEVLYENDVKIIYLKKRAYREYMKRVWDRLSGLELEKVRLGYMMKQHEDILIDAEDNRLDINLLLAATVTCTKKGLFNKRYVYTVSHHDYLKKFIDILAKKAKSDGIDISPAFFKYDGNKFYDGTTMELSEEHAFCRDSVKCFVNYKFSI